MVKSEHAYELGHKGEQAVFEILEGQGWDVEWPSGFDEDLLVNGHLTIEVKTAEASSRRGGRQKRWQFCLYPHPGRDKPFCEDVLILRCQSEPPVHFIIPGFLIRTGLTKIDITTQDPSKYKGKWSIFRGRWEVISVMEAAFQYWASLR